MMKHRLQKDDFSLVRNRTRSGYRNTYRNSDLGNGMGGARMWLIEKRPAAPSAGKGGDEGGKDRTTGLRGAAPRSRIFNTHLTDQLKIRWASNPVRRSSSLLVEA
jgi:hypothetical protein